jgi:hypothetical protein
VEIQRAVSVEDCSEDHEAHVREAVTDARHSLVSAATALGLEDPPQVITDKFRTYFGSTFKRVSFIPRLMAIRDGLGSAGVECEYPGSWFHGYFCGGSLAYVRGLPGLPSFGNIHVCQPSFDNLPPLQRMATMVHEGAHRFLNARDKGQYTLDCQETAETEGLHDMDRRINADSYGCLVQTLG